MLRVKNDFIHLREIKYFYNIKKLQMRIYTIL